MESPKLQTDLPVSLFPDGQCRLILIGKTGNGKSSTGNSILGRIAFQPQVGINSGTRQGDLQSTMRGDMEIQVIDTPGLQDTEVGDDVIADRITRSLLAMHPGPHAIILCLSCDQRFTPEEVKVFEALKEIFGDKMPSFLIVVFVKKDAIEKHGVSFEDQLSQATELQKVLAQANNRYVLFDNRQELSDNKKKDQVDQLLDKVKEVVEQNEGKFFRHKLSTELEQSMAVLRKAEMKGWEIDPEAEDLYSKLVRRSSKGSPGVLGTLEEESTPQTSAATKRKQLRESILVLNEKRVVSERWKQFESIPEPGASELSQEEITTKFKLKAPTEVSTGRRKSPAPKRPAPSPPQSPAGEHQDYKDTETKSALELAKRFEDVFKPTTTDKRPPQKPQRQYLPRDREARNSGRQIHRFEENPAADEPIRKPVSFDYEVPDRPGMLMSQKQRMVDEVLKRKLAKGMEGLNQEQTEEVEKTSKSLGKKIREGMKKFAVEKIGACRIM